MTNLTASHIHTLDYFVPQDCEAGVGLALEDGLGRYLFFLAGTRHHCPPGQLFYAGIGGHREPGESWEACAHREAQEEIGAKIELVSSPETWYVSKDGMVKRVFIQDQPTPLALYEMIHQPDAPKAGELYRIIIYRARLLSFPTDLQHDEVQGVIALTKHQIGSSLRRKPTFSRLLAEGAKVFAGAESVDHETRLYPIGTAKALGLIMDNVWN